MIVGEVTMHSHSTIYTMVIWALQQSHPSLTIVLLWSTCRVYNIQYHRLDVYIGILSSVATCNISCYSSFVMVAVALHVTSAKHMKSHDNNCAKFTQAVNAIMHWCIDMSTAFNCKLFHRIIL